VKARHKNICSLRQLSHKLGADRDNLAQFRPHRQRLVAFALDFTAVATDTFFGVLKQVVFTHHVPPNLLKAALNSSDVRFDPSGYY
jgi:hypothetical protein